jgi:hypothetical protein
MATTRKKLKPKEPTKRVKPTAKPTVKTREKESTTTKARRVIKKSVGGRPSKGADKKQRQQVFLEPNTVALFEKFAKRVSKSRGATVRPTQLEAEILENWAKKQRAKQ